VNGYNGKYQMGYQRMGQEYPSLRPGVQYGTFQDGNQGGPIMANYGHCEWKEHPVIKLRPHMDTLQRLEGHQDDSSSVSMKR
jgi:hypothetical protein